MERTPVRPRLTSVNPSRLLVPLMLSAALTAAAGCAHFDSGKTVESVGSSCAVVIEMNETSYIGGRQSNAALPLTSVTMPARSMRCDDGGHATHPTPMVATKIEGIAVGDAVAVEDRLMLAQRLWRVAWTDLPESLQPYVRR